MKKLTTRKKNYSKWYNEIIIKSELAENSSVRGCMIIKPYGLLIWDRMKSILDDMLKKTGHENAYFPLLIPKSSLSKEANHIKGFAKECAIVTHYRLKKSKNKKIIIDPKSKLKEELIIRPTSETIIWETYKKWIQSYRDLPILLNQWSNVLRWEMKIRLFLRTSEFLWQEGHTAHENKYEAIKESKKILDIYKKFLQKFMAIPVIKGKKSLNERFSGAEETYCIESMMQDGKALQSGTSHFLGQNFSKAFNVKFTNKKGNKEYVWGTSWGVSNRLIGALIMVHSDDYGLVLPPKLAPIQVVIIPIYKNNNELEKITKKVNYLKKSLKNKGIRIKYDYKNNKSPGWKFNEYEIKGVPIRLTIGPQELKKNTVELTRRDNFKKISVNQENIENFISDLLKKIQKKIYEKAKKKHEKSIIFVEEYKNFKDIIKEKGGFLLAHWDGTIETEKKIKKETKATIRCIPIKNIKEKYKCIYSGKPSSQRVIFAKSY